MKYEEGHADVFALAYWWDLTWFCDKTEKNLFSVTEWESLRGDWGCGFELLSYFGVGTLWKRTMVLRSCIVDVEDVEQRRVDEVNNGIGYGSGSSFDCKTVKQKGAFIRVGTQTHLNFCCEL